MLNNYIEDLKDEIIEETCNLINIPSVSEETGNPDMPFGKEAKKYLAGHMGYIKIANTYNLEQKLF